MIKVINMENHLTCKIYAFGGACWIPFAIVVVDREGLCVNGGFIWISLNNLCIIFFKEDME